MGSYHGTPTYRQDVYSVDERLPVVVQIHVAGDSAISARITAPLAREPLQERREQEERCRQRRAQSTSQSTKLA